MLLQIGTNDILHNYDAANAPSRLSTLIDHITSTLPQVDLFVASITPLGGDYASYESQVLTFNASIPSIVSTKASQGYGVHFVNMHSVLTTADLTDGIHPSAERIRQDGRRLVLGTHLGAGALTASGRRLPPQRTASHQCVEFGVARPSTSQTPPVRAAHSGRGAPPPRPVPPHTKWLDNGPEASRPR